MVFVIPFIRCLPFLFKLFCGISFVCHRVSALKIAFVGDTGIEDEAGKGYGHLTMNMIVNEGVDLVIGVGDFEYWGRCSETFRVTDTLNITSQLTVDKDTVVKRFKWQYGRHGAQRGWEIGIISPGEEIFRFVTPWRNWENIKGTLEKTSSQDCYDDPWDGPWEWKQFLRNYKFDFLAASGNAEVTEAPDYGSPEIWADHQRYMWELYKERIVDRNRGICRGFLDTVEPGSVEEYGERYSCLYGEDHQHHIIFLGWWQGSDSRRSGAQEEVAKSIEFIEREFSRNENAQWRYCVHHQTTAKLSAGGGTNRKSMALSGITDACRKHGALIFSGHHHLYSRTKMLESVGGESGDEPVVPHQNQESIEKGRTMSITVGMGGYGGACNGLYANAAWMERCIAKNDHRGSLIADFDENEPGRATFRYKNSLMNATTVDEFTLFSRLNTQPGPTGIPISQPTVRPTGSSQPPTVSPTVAPTPSSTAAPTLNSGIPVSQPTVRPTGSSQPPTVSPTVAPTPSSTAAPTLNSAPAPIWPPTLSLTLPPTEAPKQPTGDSSPQPPDVPTLEPSKIPLGEPSLLSSGQSASPSHSPLDASEKNSLSTTATIGIVFGSVVGAGLVFVAVIVGVRGVRIYGK